MSSYKKFIQLPTNNDIGDYIFDVKQPGANWLDYDSVANTPLSQAAYPELYAKVGKIINDTFSTSTTTAYSLLAFAGLNGRLFFGRYNTFGYSVNGGETWYTYDDVDSTNRNQPRWVLKSSVANDKIFLSNDHTIFTTTDLDNWTVPIADTWSSTPMLRSTSIDGPWGLVGYRGIRTYGNGVYISGVNSSDIVQVVSSTNGINWTTVTLATYTGYPNEGGGIDGVVYGNGRFFIFSNRVTSTDGGLNSTTTYPCWTSLNGITWTARTGVIPTNGYVSQCIYSAGTTVLSYSSTSTAGIRTSTNGGESWTTRIVASSGAEIYNWGDNYWEAFLSWIGSGSSLTYYSTNGGTSWTGTAGGITPRIDNAHAGLGKFVHYYSPTSNYAFAGTSTDGKNYTGGTQIPQLRDIGTTNRKFVYGNGYFAGITQSGNAVITSTDGINWTNPRIIGSNGHRGESSPFYDFKYEGGSFVYLTSYDVYRTSTPSQGSEFLEYTPSTVAYGHGKYLIGDLFGSYVTSTDLNNWKYNKFPEVSTSYIQANNAIYGNGIFVVTGNPRSGTTPAIATSTDAVSWTMVATPLTGNPNKCEYGNGIFVMVGSAGQIATSTNAINWSSRNSNTTVGLNGIVYNNGVFVVTGGAVARYSYDGITWRSITALTGIGSTFNTLFYSDGIYIAGGAGPIQTTRLYTYNPMTEFVVPSSRAAVLTGGYGNLFVKVKN